MTRARRPKRSDLVRRSGDLERALVDVVGEPRFDDALDEALERRHGPTTTELDDAAFANLLDYVALQREERRHFVAFFGADLVVLPGRALAERMRAYGHFRTHEVRGADGTSAAERHRAIHGRDPPPLDFAPPAELADAETVAVVYDEVDGLNFLANFGRLQAAFADPALAAKRAYRQAVLGYLNEPSIPPMALRRLAEPDPERASRVFRRVLRQPDFSSARDAEPLLRRHKAIYFAQPVLPSVTPFSETLARAQRAAPEAGERQPTRRRSAQRPQPGPRRRSGRPR